MNIHDLKLDKQIRIIIIINHFVVLRLVKIKQNGSW